MKDHDDLLLYHAPHGATDWCPTCGWGGTCANCRLAWDPDHPSGAGAVRSRPARASA